MKKVISLILVLVMCLSLCACGKSDACTCDCAQCADCEKKTHSHDKITVQGSSEQEAVLETDMRKIEFPEPVLLAEDQKVRVELIRFFEEDSPYKHVGKYVAMQITNKADYEIGVRLENLAVGGSAVEASYPNAQMPNLLSGETTTYYFEIMDTFKNTLDSLDSLYTLKGRFEVLRRTGNSSYADAYELPFSVEDSLNGGIASSGGTSSVETKKEYVLGDTVATDMAEFTLNEFLFRKGLATYSENSGNVNIDDLYLPDAGMMFATSKFTIRNLSGESYQLHSTIRIYVDYNNGYRYSSKEGHDSYLRHGKGIWKITGNGGGRGQFADLSPLMSDDVDMYIPVPQLVETDTQAPLCIIAELPTSNGSTQEFIYRIR